MDAIRSVAMAAVASAIPVYVMVAVVVDESPVLVVLVLVARHSDGCNLQNHNDICMQIQDTPMRRQIGNHSHSITM